MASVDFHAGCGSYVRISIDDLIGPHAIVLDEMEHPNSLAYPNVKVAACDLAAGHDGRCEMFVNGSLPARKPWEGYWITWELRVRNELATGYEWLTSAEACEAKSDHGYYCTRWAGHPTGHAFTVQGAS